MSFNFGIRKPLAKSRVSSGSGGRGGGDSETWVEDYWQSGVTSSYEDLKNIPDLNPGQRGIIDSEEESIINYLFEIDEDYNPDEFLNFLQTSFEDDGRYEALSITWEEYSVTLEDIWDNASGGDSQGVKKFLGVTYA
jgi:hypothetical protein